MDGFRGGALGAGQSRGGEGHPITWGAICFRGMGRYPDGLSALLYLEYL